MTTLERLISSNTPDQWLTAGALTLVTIVVLVTLQRFMIHRLKKLAERTATDIDDMIVDLLRRTRFIVLLLISVYVGTQALTIGEGTQRILTIAASVILLIQAGIWGNGIVKFLVERTARRRLAEDAAGATTLSAFGFIGRFVLWSAVLLLALDNMGFDVTTLVAGLGVAGIAIGLALQSILGDLFASLSIVLDKPFVIGDFIIVDGLMGTVERVGIKTTRIRSLGGEQLVFSNTDLLNSRIRNYKRMAERRVVFSIGVTYQTPDQKLAAIPEIIRETINSQQETRFDRAHFKEFGDSSLVFEIVYHVLSQDYNVYMDIQQAINLALYRRFAAEGVEFAYPTRTLYVQEISEGSG